jgi:hypothetical protein
MRIEILDIKGTWRSVADAARTTIGLESGDKEPTESWKRRMLLAEHSPIRKIIVNWKWWNLPYWVSTHFVRHKFGIEHWVKTQRTDRTGVDRESIVQGALIDHECEANAQAIINISRKRFCMQASPETRDAWQKFLLELQKVQPELANVCVPDCIYRGWCYEYKSCGFHKTPEYQSILDMYRKNINGWGEENENSNNNNQ